MIDITSGKPENLLVAVAHGKVTGYDYDIVLFPAIEALLKAHKKIRLLYQLAEDFQGFSAEAFWDDAKLGLAHLTAFEAVAIVTDVHWIADAVKFFGVFLRCPVKVFRNSDLAGAKEWITTTTAWRTVAEV
jgi:hypothetical protein